MLNSLNKRLIILISLIVIYNFFFWRETLGVNIVVFSLLTAISVIYLNPASIRGRLVIVSLISIVYSSALVIINNSAFSKFSIFTCLIIFTGFVHQRELKTVFSAGMTAAISFFMFPYNIIEGSKKSGNKYPVFRFVMKSAKLILLPILIIPVFYSLYAYANPLFNSYSVTFWDTISEYLNNILADYPFVRFMHIFLGLVLLMGVLYNNNVTAFRDLDNWFRDSLGRSKVNKLLFRNKEDVYKSSISRMGLIKIKMNSLISEYRIGIIFLVMINSLILFLNILDINFVWFGFEPKQVDNLAYYVHEGTYVLIFSIVLSMFIMLYLFRGNINFYSKNSLLKYLAYLWIFQNGIMAVSVALRNIYYIEYYYALSYKRIGVMIFLLLTFIGLVTMVLKIRDKRTTYNIIKINSWAAFAVMLIMSTFNWDTPIAEFNISNPDKKAVDLQYLFSLGDGVLPIIFKNKEVLNNECYDNRYFMPDVISGNEEFIRKVKRFNFEYENRSWLSWNLADYNTYKILSEIKIKKPDNRDSDPLNF